MKKVACTSTDVPANVPTSGQWVEVDVRQVFRHWLRAYRANTSVGTNRPNISDPYLLIDVRDQDYNVVKPSSVFQHCTQACECKCVVFFRFCSNNISNSHIKFIKCTTTTTI